MNSQIHRISKQLVGIPRQIFNQYFSQLQFRQEYSQTIVEALLKSLQICLIQPISKRIYELRQANIILKSSTQQLNQSMIIKQNQIESLKTSLINLTQQFQSINSQRNTIIIYLEENGLKSDKKTQAHENLSLNIINCFEQFQKLDYAFTKLRQEKNLVDAQLQYLVHKCEKNKIQFKENQELIQGLTAENAKLLNRIQLTEKQLTQQAISKKQLMQKVQQYETKINNWEQLIVEKSQRLNQLTLQNKQDKKKYSMKIQEVQNLNISLKSSKNHLQNQEKQLRQQNSCLQKHFNEIKLDLQKLMNENSNLLGEIQKKQEIIDDLVQKIHQYKLELELSKEKSVSNKQLIETISDQKNRFLEEKLKSLKEESLWKDREKYEIIEGINQVKHQQKIALIAQIERVKKQLEYSKERQCQLLTQIEQITIFNKQIENNFAKAIAEKNIQMVTTQKYIYLVYHLQQQIVLLRKQQQIQKAGIRKDILNLEKNIMKCLKQLSKKYVIHIISNSCFQSEKTMKKLSNQSNPQVHTLNKSQKINIENLSVDNLMQKVARLSNHNQQFVQKLRKSSIRKKAKQS